MARTKHTNRKVPEPVMTWTRFILPPNQEWPLWPCDLSEPSGKDAQPGPLGNREDVQAAYVGRMVEDPAQAVFLIDWDDRKNLDAFLASSACDDFLRLLPEEVFLSSLQQNEKGPEKSLQDGQYRNPDFANIEPPKEAPNVTDEPPPPPPPAASVSASSSSSMSSPSPRSGRFRFLILDRIDHWSSIEIKDRITLSAFLVSADNRDDRDESFESDIRFEIGDEQFMPEYVDRDRSRFNWAIDFSWFRGCTVGCVDNFGEGSRDEDADNQRVLERILLGGGAGVDVPNPAQTLEQPEARAPSHYVLCQITQWNAFEGKEETEEKVVHDVGFNQEWENQAQALKADGRIKAWKRERWDLRPCPGFVSYWEYC